MTANNALVSDGRVEHLADGVILYLGDCVEIMPALTNVDAVVTDPPYGSTSLRWDAWPDGWLELLVGQTPQIWCFASVRMLWEKHAQFAPWRLSQEIVWEKANGSGFHNDRFRRVHELALHLYRGKWSALYKSTPRVSAADSGVTPAEQRRTTRLVRHSPLMPLHIGGIGSKTTWERGGPRLMRSVIKAPSCRGYAEHPTQKPEAVIRPLIEYSVPPGGTVLDPFMGSGTTGVAAVTLGRRFTGIEIEPKYFAIACERIRKALKQTRLAFEDAA